MLFTYIKRIGSILVLLIFFTIGIVDLLVYLEKPEFVEISLQEIERNGIGDLEYVIITGGVSTGKYISNKTDESWIEFGIYYPLINFEALRSTTIPNRPRAKVIVRDIIPEYIDMGPQVVQGRVSSFELNKSNESIIRDICTLNQNYIVIENNWSVPNLWMSIFMIVFPGILLIMVFRYLIRIAAENMNT